MPHTSTAPVISTELEPLLTPAQAATQLAVNRATVYRWIATGKLPAVKMGTKIYRIRPADLAAVQTPTSDTRLPSQADWKSRQAHAMAGLDRVKKGLPLS